MRRFLLTAALVLTSAATSTAVAAPLEVAVPQRSAPVDFATEVAPLLNAHCAACHNARVTEGGLSLESAASLLKGGDQGAAIVPGQGDESLLLKVAAHRQESFMPPADNTVGARPLNADQLGLLKLWIDQGARGGPAHRTVAWRPLPAHHQPIFAVAVTPDGQFGIAARGNQLHVYHLPTAAFVARLVDPALASDGLAHRDVVRALAFDPAGQRLASGGFREVKLWRAPRSERLAAWEHDAALSAVAVSSASPVAATGDERGRIHLWDRARGERLRTIDAHDGAVRALALSPAGDVVYSTTGDAAAHAWNVADGTARRAAWENGAAIEALLVTADGKTLVTGGRDGQARLWETAPLAADQEAPRPTREIQAHEGKITSLAALPGAAAGVVTAGEDGRVRLWSGDGDQPAVELRHDGPVAALAIAPNGTRLASVGQGQVKLWNLDNRQSIAQLASDPRRAAAVAELDAQIAFTKSALQLAKADIKSYEGAERRIMTTAESVKKAEEERAKAEKTRDEKRAALESAGDDEKKKEAAQKALDEAETAVMVAGTVIERAQAVAARAVQTLADEQQAVADYEARLAAQEAAKMEAAAAQKEAPPPFTTAAFSTDGGRLVVAGGDGALHLFAADSGAWLQSLAPETAAVRELVATAEDTVLAVAERRIAVVSATSAWRLERTIGAEDKDEPSLADRVLALDFSPDGQHLATGGGLPAQGGELKIWNVADGALVRTFDAPHADTIFAVRFAPEGQRLATASADRFVKVFSLASDEPPQILAGHTAHVLGLSWHAEGNRLASCGSDQVVKLWDLAQGTPARTMKGTTYQIGRFKGDTTAVAFIGASEQLAVTCGDGTVRLLRISSDNDILTYSGAAGYPQAVAVTPDGQTVLVGSADGMLHRWSGQERGVKHQFPPQDVPAP